MTYNFTLWASGTNGEGSSLVVFSLIKAIIVDQHIDSILIVYSSGSSLASLIDLIPDNVFSSLDHRNIHFKCLPAIVRSYPLHFLLKLLLIPSFFSRSLLTIDDFPFLFGHNQILYCHQANLLFNCSYLWRLKFLIFRILVNKSLVFFTQTEHMKSGLKLFFPRHRFISFLHLP